MDIQNTREKLQSFINLTESYDIGNEEDKITVLNIFIELYLQDYFNDFWYNAFIIKLKSIDNDN